MAATIQIAEYKKIIFNKNPILDVRAPIEFQEGALPFSENIPILDNEERTQIGIQYKKTGREAAITLGSQLVSGTVKEQRLEAWLRFVKKNPNAVVTCFRGGLRSQYAQNWLKEAGIECPRIAGGYKAVRRFLLQQLASFSLPLIMISGATGAGKTNLLRKNKNLPMIDLEQLANHRGSAFGKMGEQPTQGSFENHLATAILMLSEHENSYCLCEDESIMVGARVIPLDFFQKMRASPIILLEETIEERVDNIFQDYILNAKHSLDKYIAAVVAISKKLGGQRTQEILKDMTEACALEDHKIWIEKLLHYYYDPYYFRSLEKRQPKILFRGKRKEVEQFLYNKH